MFIFVGTFVLLAEDFVVVVKRRPCNTLHENEAGQ